MSLSIQDLASLLGQHDQVFFWLALVRGDAEEPWRLRVLLVEAAPAPSNRRSAQNRVCDYGSVLVLGGVVPGGEVGSWLLQGGGRVWMPGPDTDGRVYFFVMPAGSTSEVPSVQEWPLVGSHLAFPLVATDWPYKEYVLSQQDPVPWTPPDRFVAGPGCPTFRWFEELVTELVYGANRVQPGFVEVGRATVRVRIAETRACIRDVYLAPGTVSVSVEGRELDGVRLEVRAGSRSFSDGLIEPKHVEAVESGVQRALLRCSYGERLPGALKIVLSGAGRVLDESDPTARNWASGPLRRNVRADPAIAAEYSALTEGADSGPSRWSPLLPYPRPTSGKGRPGKAVILSALGIEYDAVREHLSDPVEQVNYGTGYERGFFEGKHCRWEVLIAEVGAGNVAAAQQTERALNVAEAQVGLFVGVGGGLKDVKLGDVVAATKVYNYHAGKADREFLMRPDLGQSDFGLVQRARSCRRGTAWHARIHGPRRGEPVAHVGPIAAGEQVVSHTRSATYRFLRKQYSDAVAVEMEGRGFLEAVYAHSVAWLVVRGISDLIAGKKGSDAQGWQQQAARHAAAFAFEVLWHLAPQESAAQLLGALQQARLQPSALQEPWSEIERALNPPGSSLVVRPEAKGIRRESRSPTEPIHMEVKARLPAGMKMADVFDRALQTMEPVAVEGVEMLAHDFVCGDNRLALLDAYPELERRGVRMTLQAEPLAQAVPWKLVVPETGEQLENLELAPWPIPGGGLRLTNHRQSNCAVEVSFDLPAAWLEDEKLDALPEDDPKSAMQVSLRYHSGRTVHEMVQVYRFMRAVREPRDLLLVPVRNQQHVLRFQGQFGGEPEAFEDPLMDAFALIHDTFPADTHDVVLPEELPRSEIAAIKNLAELLRTGEHRCRRDDFVKEATGAEIEGMVRAVKGGHYIVWREEDSRTALLGTEIELGPTAWLPLTLQAEPDEVLATAKAVGSGTQVIAYKSLLADGSVVCRFERFWRFQMAIEEWVPPGEMPEATELGTTLQAEERR